MSFRRLLPIYLLICCLILPVRAWINKPVRGARITPQRLVLVLDGVPYQTIKDLVSEGLFSRFKEPSRMISTFPSLTNPAMIEILGTSDSPGYEDHYFDRARNRLAGTIQDRLRGGRFIQGTFRETFDYHAPAYKGALGYLAAPAGAVLLAQADLSSFREAFRKSQALVFIGYIGETDSLAHMGGEKHLKSFLRTLDRLIEELITESDGRLQVEMFSDHGNHYTEYREVKLGNALKRAGFDAVKSLVNPRSVVLPRHGLVGASELFTFPESREKVAGICAGVEGVDFAAFVSGENSIDMISHKGRARLLRDGSKFKYENAGGDPLDLDGISTLIKNSGEMDVNGFASEEIWWQRTRSHRYVDPLRRIFDGFNKNVRNRADVIVSYRDGYLLGSPVLSIFARMRATHGNMLRSETEGFAISTRRGLGEAVRGIDLKALFELDQRQTAGAFFSGEVHCRIGPSMAISLR